VLRKSGVWDRALFILMADHGEEFGEHGGWFHEQSAYEELLHVPLIVHFPGDKHGGRRIRERVSLLDVMPTVLDYLGHPELCAACRGASLLPLLRPGGAPAYRSAVMPAVRMNQSMYYRPFAVQRGDINIVVRKDQWKGIWNADLSALELYDLVSDPAERTNLSARQSELAAELGRRAAEEFNSCQAALRQPVVVESGTLIEQGREKLKALGYFN
jgi:arylsulfatase A-like enzyme